MDPTIQRQRLVRLLLLWRLAPGTAAASQIKILLGAAYITAPRSVWIVSYARPGKSRKVGLHEAVSCVYLNPRRAGGGVNITPPPVFRE